MISPARRSRIRIGFGPEPDQAGDSAAGGNPGVELADCNFTRAGINPLQTT